MRGRLESENGGIEGRKEKGNEKGRLRGRTLDDHAPLRSASGRSVAGGRVSIELRRLDRLEQT
jgi:hypothetical protein